jgi:hypothetical protein
MGRFPGTDEKLQRRGGQQGLAKPPHTSGGGGQLRQSLLAGQLIFMD